MATLKAADAEFREFVAGLQIRISGGTGGRRKQSLNPASNAINQFHLAVSPLLIIVVSIVALLFDRSIVWDQVGHTTDQRQD
jgi:hypothetical protein